MKFEVNGEFYTLEFQRYFKPVRLGVDEAGNDITGDSTYPYTSVYLWKGLEPIPFRSYTVGCSHVDQFSREDGRRNALRMLSKGKDQIEVNGELVENPNGLTKAVKAAMWATYLQRPRPKSKPAPVVSSEPV